MLALHSKTQEKKKRKIITLKQNEETGSVGLSLKEFKGAGLN
jgi:hypothetical protein